MTDGLPTALILSFSDIASDPRVLKEVAVAARRCRVTTLGFGGPPALAAEHLSLPWVSTAPRTAAGLAALATRRYDAAYEAVPAVVAARSALRGRRFDLVICNDANTLPVALDVAGDAPVWADMHEYAPREAENLLWWRLLLQRYVTHLCAAYLPRVQHVSSVSRGLVEEYRRQFGLSPVLVRNSADYVALSPTPVGRPIRYVHLGAAIRNRHLEDMIDAVVGLQDRATLDLYLIPGDARYIEELRRRASGQPHVRLHKPVSMAEVVPTLNLYDVGVFSPPTNNFNSLHGLANKLFQFVQARLALLFGPNAEMAEIIRQHDLGVVVPEFGAAALRTAMRALDEESVARFKVNSDRAARELSSDTDNRVREQILDRMLTRGEDR